MSRESQDEYEVVQAALASHKSPLLLLITGTKPGMM